MFGPIYCETPQIVSSFPAESWNTWSNLIIIAFGLLAAYIVARRTSKAWDLWVLVAFLIANGIGSFLWHAFRTPSTLALDTLPGVLFLLAFLYIWTRRFLSRKGALFSLVAFFILAIGFSAGAVALIPSLPFFVPLAPVVIAFGIWLIVKSARASRRAASCGGAALLSALAALFFRSVDLLACPYFVHGTHFLWHMSLSFAAFLGILALLAIDKARRMTA